MKKCPYCAEEIQNEAIKCRHCGGEIFASDSVSVKGDSSMGSNKENDKKIQFPILKFIIILFTWYVSVPVIVLWYIWKRTTWSKWKKLTISIAFGFLAVVLLIIVFYKPPRPILVITDPSEYNWFKTDPTEYKMVESSTSTTTISGTYYPDDAKFEATSGTGTVYLKTDGTFIFEGDLVGGENTFTFQLSNETGKDVAMVKIIKQLTEEEESQREIMFEEQKKMEEEKKAKELGEQKAWEQSKAGQICKAHPEWSKNDCERLANNEIWIGMSVNMLKYRRGLPNSANPSNYGSGTQWQWCWYNYTPSCFYGGDDEIVESYN